MNTTFKPGDRVYYIQEDNEVYDGIVHCLYHANDPDLSEHIMLKTLLQSQPYAIAPATDVFFNLRPAMSEAKARKKRQLQQYKNEIKNLQDLISFPLHHDLNQNGMAREAYLARAEELGYAPV